MKVHYGLLVSGCALLVSCSGMGNAGGERQVKTPAPPVASAPSGWTNQTRAAGEYLVRVNEGTKPEAISNLYVQYKVKSISQVQANLFLISIEQDPGPASFETFSRKSDFIKSTQPNYLYKSQ